MGLGVKGFELRAKARILGFNQGFRVYGLGFRVQGLGFGV